MKTATEQKSLIPLNGEPKEAAIVLPTPKSVLELAVQQGANVETLTKLFELQERWEKGEARKAFDTAFAAFQAEMPVLEKTKEVSFGQGKTAYKYTPLDVIAKTVRPVLAKHGLSFNWTQAQGDGQITVTCILKHVQGHAESNTLSGPADASGSKNPTQAIASGTSYLRRYTFLGVIGTATGDEDNDGLTIGNAADFISNMETATTLEELGKRYKEAITAALQAQDPKAVDLFMQARKKYERELRA